VYTSEISFERLSAIPIVKEDDLKAERGVRS